MSPDGIDLWQFTLDRPGAMSGLLALLSPEERRRFREYENAEFARAFAIRRAARRAILANYLGIEPLDVQTCDAPSGKPEIAEPSPALYFNTSHSSNRGVVAVTRRFPIGADVERVRKIKTRALAEGILSAHERVEFDHTNRGDRDAGILSTWTAKEAVVKGIGIGLDLNDLPQINIQFLRAPAVWVSAQLSGRMAAYGRWYVYALAPSDGYSVTIAAPAKAAVTVINASRILDNWGI